MAVIWQNTLNGPNGVAVTVANSAAHGNALDEVTAPAVYSTGWAAAGSASALLGDGANAGTLWAAFATQAAWSIRLYARIPATGFLQVHFTSFLVEIDDEFSVYTLGTTDVSADAGSLVGQPIRIEIARVGMTTTYRVWWTDPHSAGAPDHTHSETGSMGAFDHLAVQAGYGAATHVDELAIGQGEWIGPVAVPVVGAVVGALALEGEIVGHKRAVGHIAGTLELGGEVDGHAVGGARGRLALAGEIVGRKRAGGVAIGGLVLTGEIVGHKRAVGAVAGALALDGGLVQQIVPVPALGAHLRPARRLAATIVRR